MLNRLIIKDYSHIYEGCKLSKELRHQICGNVAGGSGSMNPEKYQRKCIIDITGISCDKTNLRINRRTNRLVNIKNPMTLPDGFDYTENFDGIQKINDINIYINLRSVVGKGGSQTRTLKDSYNFIEAQAKYLLDNDNKILFANILDGDESFCRLKHFNYLLSIEPYNIIKGKIYIGDLKGYFKWLKTSSVNTSGGENSSVNTSGGENSSVNTS